MGGDPSGSMPPQRRWRWRAGRVIGLATAAALVLGVVEADRSGAAPECPNGAALNVIAHPDDDLLFFGPDLMNDVERGACVRTVVVTAGDAGSSYGWASREDGLMAAYAFIAGTSNDWSGQDAGVAGHPMPLRRLDGNPRVSIVFMRLPDGFPYGGGSAFGGFQSLEKLWDAAIGEIDAIDGSSSYSRSDLIGALGALMADFGPDQVNGMDYLAAGGGDHSDHYASARFAHAAHQQYSGAHVFTGYQGYGISSRPPNLSEADVIRKRDAFFTYAPYDGAVCQDVQACESSGYADWWERRYTVGSESGGGGTSTTSTPTTVPSTTTTVPGGVSVNVALNATATASSQNTSTGQTADKAIDASTSGYPGDYTREWATVGGGAGSWLQLSWTTPQTLDRIVLYDRPNTSDQITAATLTFSDGSTVNVGTLNNAGSATTVSFSARATTSVRLTITAVSSSTWNIGLAEIEAWRAAGGGTTTTSTSTTTSTTSTSTTAPSTTTTTSTSTTSTPTTVPSTTTTVPGGVSVNVALNATATASSQNTSTGQTADKAIDASTSGYPGDYTREWATVGGGAGSWLQLSWTTPQTLDRIVLYDRPNTSDQITAATLTFSDGSTVNLGTLNNAGSATTVSFSARATTSVRLTITAVSSSTWNIGLAEIQTWTATGGTTTTSTTSTTAAPTTTTTTPTTTTSTTSTTSTTPSTTVPSTTTTVPGGVSVNVALNATATASSQNASTGQTADKAIDASTSGYPGDYTREWATVGGGAGSWLQLSWTTPQTLDRIVLYDRPNTSDQITAATLTFSDGSTVSVGALNNSGAATTVTFSARTSTSVRLTITAVSSSTWNIGLAEIQTWTAI